MQSKLVLNENIPNACNMEPTTTFASGDSLLQSANLQMKLHKFLKFEKRIERVWVQENLQEEITCNQCERIKLIQASTQAQKTSA